MVNGSVVGPVVVNTGGTLQGTGSLGGLVTVAAGGTLAPGNRPGTINLGSLTLNSGAVTNIELAGTTPGTQFDHVNVTGQLALGGTLAVSLINNFTPQPGQAFDDPGLAPGWINREVLRAAASKLGGTAGLGHFSALYHRRLSGDCHRPRRFQPRRPSHGRGHSSDARRAE